jgi:hypothetical protein
MRSAMDMDADGNRWRALADFWTKHRQSDSNCWLRLWMECDSALMHGSTL